jgi:hypothetical protein
LGKYLRISSYIRKPFLIYDFATAPLFLINEEKFLFFFTSVAGDGIHYFILKSCRIEQQPHRLPGDHCPGIHSASLCSLAGTGTSNRVVVPARQAGNGFLGSLKRLQIRALEPVKQRQPCTDKKENQFFLKYKEIQSRAVA